MVKPHKLKTEHLQFLEQLSEAGVTNMLHTWLSRAFPELGLKHAKSIVAYYHATKGKS